MKMHIDNLVPVLKIVQKFLENTVSACLSFGQVSWLNEL